MKKIISAALAAALAASLTGCVFATPATVGTLGEVEIPAGVYLYEQLAAYQSAAALATDASGVKEVLAAQVTPEDAEATVSAADYVAAETLENLQYYAAVESRFAEAGLTLDEDAQAQVEALVEQYWAYYEERYTNNGIGQQSLRQVYANSAKASALFEYLYGEGGEQAVSDSECLTYLEQEALSGRVLMLPMSNVQDATAGVTEDQLAALQQIAEDTVAQINTGNTLSELYTGVLEQSFAALGMTYTSEDATGYYSTQILLPDDLAYYDQEDGSNTLADPVRAVDNGQAALVELNGYLVIFERQAATDLDTLDNIKTTYSLLSAMKSDEFEADMIAYGAALTQGLDESARKTYAASKIEW